jgi:hypothetical protein
MSQQPGPQGLPSWETRPLYTQDQPGHGCGFWFMLLVLLIIVQVLGLLFIIYYFTEPVGL